jgi:aspartate/methionine/tyrosine aminotransferase
MVDKETIKKNNEQNETNVSSRCIFASTNTPLPYKQAMVNALKNPCHPIENKNGYVVVCRAENKLITNMLSKRLATKSMSEIAFGHESTYRYDDVRGLHATRRTVANFIMRKFVKEAGIAVKPDDIVLGSGATSILNYLFYFLAEENEVVLIPAPYYAAFDVDTKVSQYHLTS